MARTRVRVTCLTCEFEATHDRLRTARTVLSQHETETGHDVDWTIESLAAGVEKAGADATVCGHTTGAPPDSPLARVSPRSEDA